MADDPCTGLAARIDDIEEAYEFMLAYAAQGRETDAEAADAADIRNFLQQASDALDGLEEVASACAAAKGQAGGPVDGFLEILGQDAGRARVAIELVLAQPGISSEMVDNLNASIHVRKLLTDMFLIDSILQATPGE